MQILITIFRIIHADDTSYYEVNPTITVFRKHFVIEVVPRGDFSIYMNVLSVSATILQDR